MSESMEEKRDRYTKKLQDLHAKQRAETQSSIDQIRSLILQEVKPALPEDIARLLTGANQTKTEASRVMAIPRHPPATGLFRMTGDPSLRELDETFIHSFRIDDYYPSDRLQYPIIYCETLAEFFNPFVTDMNYSSQMRQLELDRLIEQAQEMAEKTSGGGIFGVNMPGQGCYLNGWLFAYGQSLTPLQAMDHPPLFRAIIGVAAHEKLGHGFLGLYSKLGETKTRLGLTLAETAQRFGVIPAEDPLATLRLEQANLLHLVSLILEEGWANWISLFMKKTLFNDVESRSYQLADVVKIIQSMPDDLADGKNWKAALLTTIEILFRSQPVSLAELHQAMFLSENISETLDIWIAKHLGQPYRYVLGELLFERLNENLGNFCVPYAALIAANVDFRPDLISLSDLRELLSRDPRLSPDTRLAALSRLQLQKPDSLSELVGRAMDELSFTVPDELKKAAGR